MSSSTPSEHYLTLVSMKVVVLSRWQSLLHSRRYHSKAQLSVSAEHAAAVGPRKHLCFQNTCIPCVFLRWFCGMKHLCLNTLEFINCKTDTPKRTIREHFERHANFHVQHFRDEWIYQLYSLGYIYIPVFMYYRVLVHEGKVVSSLVPRPQPPWKGLAAFSIILRPHLILIV